LLNALEILIAVFTGLGFQDNTGTSRDYLAPFVLVNYFGLHFLVFDG